MVTIKDVARAAGVSVATVSRVHNDSTQVTEDTRGRVRAVAARLGYSPHSGARSLSTRKTNGIGVLLPDLHGEFYSELIRGIDQRAQRHGFHLLLASSHNEKAAIAAALQIAERKAINAGAERDSLKTIEIEDMPIAYLPGNSLRVRVRVAGALDRTETSREVA